MIEFGLSSLWAEINAMPCPPDKFEVVIPAEEVLSNSRYSLQITLEGIANRFPEHECVSFECRRRHTNVLRFKRYPPPKPQITTQDIILRKMNTNGLR